MNVDEINNDSNLPEIEADKVNFRRKKSVKHKIKAFEALASCDLDLQKPQNWWLIQKDNEEYIRASVFTTPQDTTIQNPTRSPIFLQNQEKKPFVRLSNDNIENPSNGTLDIHNTHDTVDHASTPLSNRLSISPTFLNTLKQTIQNNAPKTPEINDFGLFDSHVSNSPKNKPIKPVVPKKPDKLSTLSHSNSLYESSDVTASHRNSLYSNGYESVQSNPRRISDQHKANIYEEIDFAIHKTNIRRKSSSSVSNVSSSLPEKKSIKLSNVIQEVITLEHNYIDRLERGIEIYVNQGVKIIEDVFQYEYKNLYANLLKIYDFHKNQLYRSLVACNQDVFNIANVFHTYITNNSFYPYVLFQVDRVHLEKMLEKHKDEFNQLSKTNGDKLGVKNFLMEPVQRLPRYILLFSEIIKLLSVNDETIKNFLSVCCMTEKQLRRLVISVDQANSLTELEIHARFDWREQGKFKKMSRLKYSDAINNVQYESHVYLFENSLLCTQADSQVDNRLLYRTHIDLDDIYFMEFLDDNTIQLTLRRYEICFNGDTVNIQEWMTALKSVNDYDEAKDFLVINDDTYNEKQYLQIFKRIEQNYIDFMSIRKKHYLSNTTSKLGMFINVLNEILEFHSGIMVPMLESKDTTLVNACEMIIEYIKDEDGPFEAYKVYIALVPHAVEHLSKVMTVTPMIREFLETPLYHFQNVKTFINKIVKASIKSGTINKMIIQSLANLQKEFCTIHKMVLDTFKIHSKIGDTSKGVKNYGVVRYSDLVSSKVDVSDKKKMRIFLMNKGVVAVKVAPNHKEPDDDIFRSLKWHLPYPVTWEDDTNTPDLLKLYPSGQKHKSYKIVFQTQNKKQKFIEHLYNLIKFVSV